ncbi:MAG: Rho termination factor N-terminal domain-containing protein [Clostridia bacterium]|nr:Rho termination factor N-terminal domain-containing protein [Clostridia bacterium]
MDLQEKPLYALRDLARRLGVPAPTALKKDELIKEINVYKEQAEKNFQNSDGNPARMGRPILNNYYIAIKRDENGKIIFYDAEQPLTEKIVPDEPKIIIKKRPAAITDSTTRKTLTDVKSLLEKICFALDKVLERD